MKAKHCPFCGGEAYIAHVYNMEYEGEGYHVFCHDCLARSGDYDTKEEAVKAWNGRADGL